MNVIELIRMIKDRPAIYIGRHSIFCLNAFIAGWHFRNPKEDVQMKILTDFSLWIDDSFFNSSRYTCS